jgi:hypothetical protein
MVRQIVRRPMAPPVPAGGPPPPVPPAPPAPSDSYGEQIVKLIPAESVTLFVFLDGVISAAAGGDKPQVSHAVGNVLFLLVVVTALIGTPLYLKRGAQVTRWEQIAVSEAALLVWAAATAHTPAILWPWWFPPIVWNVALPLFTFVAPLLLPKQMG